MNENIRTAKALVRLARILVGYRPNQRDTRVSDSYAVNKRYVNVTGEFRHPTMHGFWGDVKDATFTVTRNGLDWEKGTWTRGTWKDGTWHDGRWMNGKWLAGTWKGGMWFGGYDRFGTHHRGGDSPNRWRLNDRKTGDIYNPSLRDIFGDADYDLDKDDRDLINKIFGEGASYSPYRDLTPQDIFNDDVPAMSSSRKRELMLDDIFGDKKPEKKKSEPTVMTSVLPPRRNRNREKWKLTKPSTGNYWDWYLPVGLTESDIMARCEAAVEECDHQRIRTTWDTFMDDDDKYSVRDENDNVLYTFEKVQ